MPDAADRDRRHQVWQALRDSTEPLGITALSRLLAVHPNTIRFHLDALLRDGRVEQVAAERSGPGRPAQRFRVLPGMDPAGPRHYQLLARLLVDGLAAVPDGSARAAAAGREWGRALALDRSDPRRSPVDRLMELLDELGFAPDRSIVDDEVRLRHCPFLEIARSRSGVVCPIHQGLMQGALAGWAAPLTVDRLTPFAEPDLCTAHLAVAA